MSDRNASAEEVFEAAEGLLEKLDKVSEFDDKREVPADTREVELLVRILNQIGYEDPVPLETSYKANVLTLDRLKEEIIVNYKSVNESGIVNDDFEMDQGTISADADDLLDGFLRATVLDKYMVYLSLASGLIEKLSIDLFEDELIDEEFLGKNKTDTLLEREMNQEMREQFLLRTGIIGQDLQGKMTRVRRLRNNAVHNDEIDIDEGFVSNIERINDTVHELEQRVLQNYDTDNQE